MSHEVYSLKLSGKKNNYITGEHVQILVTYVAIVCV